MRMALVFKYQVIHLLPFVNCVINNSFFIKLTLVAKIIIASKGVVGGDGR